MAWSFLIPVLLHAVACPLSCASTLSPGPAQAGLLERSSELIPEPRNPYYCPRCTGQIASRGLLLPMLTAASQGGKEEPKGKNSSKTSRNNSKVSSKAEQNVSAAL